MRKKNTIKNFLTTFLPFLIIGVLGFFKTKIFIGNLGDEIAALDQLFYQILAYLSLAEGGIGLFIVQKYYGFLAHNEYDKINQLYTSSKKMFRNAGLFMIGSGLFLSFFLKLFTNNNLQLPYIQLVFMLFMIKNSIDYFMFSPRYILQADQRLYKINILINTTRICETIAQIVLVLLGVDYLLVLIPGIIFNILFNLIINKIIYKEYPWLNDNKTPNTKDLKGIRHLINQKISGVIYSNTDILVLSTMLNPTIVVIYSAYNYISKYLSDFVYLLVSAVSSSFANVLHKENKETQYQIFREVNTSFLFIASFVSICFFLLSNSFITLWIGEKYLLPFSSLLLMTMVLFINVTQKSILLTKDNLGLFKETKKAILLEALTNLVLSISLVFFFQVNGILFGTVFATLATTAWYIPRYLYKYHFERKWSDYIIDFVKNIGIAAISLYLIHFIPLVAVHNYLDWFINAIIVSVTTGIVLCVSFGLLFPSFRSLGNRLFSSLLNKIKKLLHK